MACTRRTGVGLEHGDNPMRMDVPFEMAEDIALEENMVITIDMPYIESRRPGRSSAKTSIRITKTGFEPMHTPGNALVIV